MQTVKGLERLTVMQLDSTARPTDSELGHKSDNGSGFLMEIQMGAKTAGRLGYSSVPKTDSPKVQMWDCAMEWTMEAKKELNLD